MHTEKDYKINEEKYNEETVVSHRSKGQKQQQDSIKKETKFH